MTSMCVLPSVASDKKAEGMYTELTRQALETGLSEDDIAQIRSAVIDIMRVNS